MLNSRQLNLAASVFLVSAIISGCGSKQSTTTTTTATTTSEATATSASSGASKPMVPPAAVHLNNPFEAAAFSIIAEREVQGLNADILKYFGDLKDDAGRKLFNQACQDCKDGNFDKAIDGFYKAIATIPPLKHVSINRGNNPIIELRIAILQFGALDCSKFGQPAKGLKMLTDAENFAATLPGPQTYEKSFVYDAHCSARANQYERAANAFKSIEKTAGSVLMKANARVAQARMLEKMGKAADAEKMRVEAQQALTRANDVNQLIVACQSGTLEQVKKLVKEKGVSAKGLGEAKAHHLSTYSPLMNTIMSGDKPDIAEFLLNKGADANESDYEGTTPLHLAAKYNDVKTAKVLLENKANVDAVCADVAPGNFDPTTVDQHLTPLLIAAKNNNLDMVRLLIEDGHAKVTAENSEHKNAADLATDEKVLAYLAEKNVKPH